MWVYNILHLIIIISDVPILILQNAVLNRVRQVKSRTLARARTKTKSVCTRLQAAHARLRHCGQEMMRQSIGESDKDLRLKSILSRYLTDS